MYTRGGRTPTGIDAVKWAARAVELGSGEILLTSMDEDGQKQGYDLQLTCAVSQATSVPVIASGGAGNLEHLYDALDAGQADAVLAASIFHFGEYSIGEAKDYLSRRGVPVRPPRLIHYDSRHDENPLSLWERVRVRAFHCLKSRLSYSICTRRWCRIPAVNGGSASSQ